MYTAAERFLLQSKDSIYNNQIVNAFAAKNNNGEHKVHMQKLLTNCNSMVPGNTIPNQVMVTSDNTLKDLRSIIKRPTVMFFWSSESAGHNKRIHLKAAEMMEKYPEYQFIGICVGSNQNKWLKLLELKGFNSNTEFRLNDPENAKKQLVINSLNKAIIVDANGVILENNTNMSRSNFELELLGFLNQ